MMMEKSTGPQAGGWREAGTQRRNVLLQKFTIPQLLCLFLQGTAYLLSSETYLETSQQRGYFAGKGTS